MTLVRYLDRPEPHELLGMVRCGERLVFAIAEPDGTVIGCGGKDLARWSAPVTTLYPQRLPLAASPGVDAATPGRSDPPCRPGNLSDDGE